MLFMGSKYIKQIVFDFGYRMRMIRRMGSGQNAWDWAQAATPRSAGPLVGSQAVSIKSTNPTYSSLLTIGGAKSSAQGLQAGMLKSTLVYNNSFAVTEDVDWIPSKQVCSSFYTSHSREM